MTEERIRLLNDLGMVWSRRSEDWNDRLEEVKTFKEKNGRVVVPPSKESLHEWLRDQRTQWRKFKDDPMHSTLTREQVGQLEELGMDFDLRAAKWHTRYLELLEYKKTHGHMVVPKKYPVNQQLSNWCSTQRRHYKLMKADKSSQLTKERAELLDEVGFEWEISVEQRANTTYKKTWDEFYAELCVFKDDTGSCVMQDDSDPELKQWCEKQRTDCRAFQSSQPTTMTKEQVEKLSRIGFNWDAKPNGKQTKVKSWDEFFGDLLAHHLLHNTFVVTSSKGGDELCNWVQEQRVEYAKFVDGAPSTMSSECLEKLRSVKFPFRKVAANGKNKTTKGKSWEEMYAELLQFRIVNKSWEVPNTMRALSKWVEQQRHVFERFDQARNTCDVLSDHYNKLQKVGFPLIVSQGPPPQASFHAPSPFPVGTHMIPQYGSSLPHVHTITNATSQFMYWPNTPYGGPQYGVTPQVSRVEVEAPSNPLHHRLTNNSVPLVDSQPILAHQSVPEGTPPSSHTSGFTTVPFPPSSLPLHSSPSPKLVSFEAIPTPYSDSFEGGQL
jgi:Helicase associated domain